jgi:hypothetical protein
MVWERVEGAPRLFAISSWGGTSKLSAGPDLARLQVVGPLTFTRHPGHGVWFESIVAAEGGAWYGYYHHERAAEECGRPERQLPRIGAARSMDRGLTWDDLGIIIDAPPGSMACESANRFVLGGVGDVGAMLDHESKDLYLYYSQYGRDPLTQGVAVARLAWADRDEPVGKVTIWNDGAWLPARPGVPDDGPDVWVYPSGTPLVRPTRPFHDASSAADVFWGPSIHWNTYLERYVMLLNRARDDQFGQDGVYVAYATTLSDPRGWSAPRKIFNGGGWYPQAIGLEAGRGTDRLADRRARFFITGKSEHMIEFER